MPVCPKTLVRYLVQYEAETAATAALHDVLLDILATPVSPELLPAKDGEIAQITEDLVGPYELHDFYLYYVLRCGFGPAKSTGWQRWPLQAGQSTRMPCCTSGCATFTGAFLPSSSNAAACRTAPRWAA